MSKKKPAEQPVVPDREFGIVWEKLPSALSAPGPFRTLRRRQWLARWNFGAQVERWQHRKAIIQEIWPEGVFNWHDWSDRRIRNLSNHCFTSWIGPAGSAKTTCSAVMALEWWLEAPHESAVIVCSTTKEMLRTRIWGQIVHYHAAIDKKFGYVGELLDTACFIRFRDGDWKNGIKGIAVQDGPIEEAINNIIGMHTSRVWVILDEAQGVREAIMKAIPNLLKNPESRMHIMGNPNSFTSLLCRYGAPIDGWESVPKFSPSWQTRSHGYEGTGEGLFFDGRESPAVRDAEWGRRNPWMINQRQIDAHLDAVGGNENDPDFMTQSIGWPPSMGVESTVLDSAIVQTFKCQQSPVWTHGKTACAFLDPAYEGADKAILQFGWRGWTEDEDGGRWTIAFGDTLTVPIDAESDRPIHYQIVDYCKAQCEARNIPPDEFSLFATGEGGGLKAIFDTEWGVVNGIEEGGSPTERPVGAMNKTAKQEYDTRASELCFLLREFALGNGLRGLPEKATEQATKRQTFHRNGKWCVEPKTGSKGRVDASGRSVKGFKQRMGYSPDEFDAAMGLCEHCRLKGAEPGTGRNRPSARAESMTALKKSDAEWSESNYTETEDYRQYQLA